MALERNWPVNAHRTIGTVLNPLKQIAVNNLNIFCGHFVTKLASWFMDKSTEAQKIDGVSLTKKLFKATNQTVEKEQIIYKQANPEETYSIKITGGNLAQTNIGEYFCVVSQTDHTVDIWSADATAGQLQLVSIISPTVGEFVIANTL